MTDMNPKVLPDDARRPSGLVRAAEQAEVDRLLLAHHPAAPSREEPKQ